MTGSNGIGEFLHLLGRKEPHLVEFVIAGKLDAPTGGAGKVTGVDGRSERSRGELVRLSDRGGCIADGLEVGDPDVRGLDSVKPELGEMRKHQVLEDRSDPTSTTTRG